MNKAGGFIVLHRKILDWEWYADTNTFRLFVHLLLSAYFEDKSFRGIEIKRGQIVTSLSSLAKKTQLTIQQTRTALEHLQSTGEITNESTSQYRIITIVNYDKYQDRNKRSNKQITNDQQTDQQTEQQHNNNINNINKVTNKQGIGGIPPTLDEVTTYIKEIGSQVDPGKFFDHYESCGWILKGGQKMKDWKATIRNWQRRETSGRTEQGQYPGSGKGSSGETRQDYSDLYNHPGAVQL